ncbi:MAG: polysaccharide pyruvyl transferase family protein [Bacteroidales bacterium]|nr:polysaccharide pyruvyl transferase family protein [Bacteroidales bacterium]
MIKVAFITVHVGFNFGSKLQAIATSEVLKKLGYLPTLVNYVPSRVTYKRYWQTSFSSILKFLRRFLFFPIQVITRYNFDSYLNKHCKVSKPIYAEGDFMQRCPKADVYISGSDQLWNYKHNEGNDKHYFFDGIEGKKIAYASSIGMTSLPDDYAAYVKEQLLQYSAISVREQSAVELLDKMGISATHVLDPTFMLNKEEWKPFASKRLVKEKYLFVYLPYNIKDKDLIYRSVRKIAKEKDMKVVSYSDNVIKDRYADQTIYFVNPGDVLSLILHAEVVITNSFHGTAFSINLNKQFWTYMPSSFSTRITSILDLCDLNNRLLDAEITDGQVNEIADFNNTNNVLQQERQKAYDFLTKALQ